MLRQSRMRIISLGVVASDTSTLNMMAPCLYDQEERDASTVLRYAERSVALSGYAGDPNSCL